MKKGCDCPVCRGEVDDTQFAEVHSEYLNEDELKMFGIMKTMGMQLLKESEDYAGAKELVDRYERMSDALEGVREIMYTDFNKRTEFRGYWDRQEAIEEGDKVRISFQCVATNVETDGAVN